MPRKVKKKNKLKLGRLIICLIVLGTIIFGLSRFTTTIVKENIVNKQYYIASTINKVTMYSYDEENDVMREDKEIVRGNEVSSHDKKKVIEIFREDSNDLAKKIKCDIAYIDPPYNSRQYSRFYHVLENLTKWEKPKLKGTALKPPSENMSEYCRSSAPIVFEDLINHLNVRYIVVTYNNTYNSKSSSSRNKITLEQIKEILEKKGYTREFAKHHQFFNAGKTDFDDHKEYVFITEVGRHEGN